MTVAEHSFLGTPVMPGRLGGSTGLGLALPDKPGALGAGGEFHSYAHPFVLSSALLDQE